jgi:hypothetical protein
MAAPKNAGNEAGRAYGNQEPSFDTVFLRRQPEPPRSPPDHHELPLLALMPLTEKMNFFTDT